jgi:hypothetical protein
MTPPLVTPTSAFSACVRAQGFPPLGEIVHAEPAKQARCKDADGKLNPVVDGVHARYEAATVTYAVFNTIVTMVSTCKPLDATSSSKSARQRLAVSFSASCQSSQAERKLLSSQPKRVKAKGKRKSGKGKSSQQSEDESSPRAESSRSHVTRVRTVARALTTETAMALGALRCLRRQLHRHPPPPDHRDIKEAVEILDRRTVGVAVPLDGDERCRKRGVAPRAGCRQ